MKKSENDTGELQITALEQVEIHNPQLVLRAFTEDFSLASVRHLIATMRDVSVTTENVFFGNALNRDDLLHVTRHIIRFFEAAYLYLTSHTPQDGKLVLQSVGTEKPTDHPKLTRVLQKSIPSRLSPYTFPCLILSGKWMEKAGFHAGDEVRVSFEHRKIIITVEREWDKERGDFRMRA